MLEGMRGYLSKYPIKKLSNAECKFDILFFLEKVSFIFFFIIEAKLLLSLDTGSKCKKKKIKTTGYFNATLSYFVP